MGFEPTLEFPLNTLSKRAPSATRPSLRGALIVADSMITEATMKARKTVRGLSARSGKLEIPGDEIVY